MTAPVQVVILAAGRGKRMCSRLPKVLHTLAGKPLLEHVIHTALKISASTRPIIIYGHQGEELLDVLHYHPVTWIEQKEQQGTGHALLHALPALSDEHKVLILCGDVPLISEQTLRQLIETTAADAFGMLTAHLSDPYGYGRIKRDANHRITGIVEEQDAKPEERAINEINPGVYFVASTHLKRWLPALKQHNAQHEYYLTDIIATAVAENIHLHSVQPKYVEEILGVNDKKQLATLERFYQQAMAQKWLLQGVTLFDPARIDIRGEVELGRDVTIDVNVIFEGKVVIGDECVIGAHTVLRDVTLGKRVVIKSHSVIEHATIDHDCVVGPFTRIRQHTVLAEAVHIGNFVEIKKSAVGEGSKINHLSYIGDSEVGKDVNIGAGTITCNYDGANKHKTVIADNAFIGSGTQLVAPVVIGKGAMIGAGSTITSDAPSDKLTLARAKQLTVPHWQRPKKKD